MERPEVTLHDPAAPNRPADVLGDDEPRSLRRPLLAGAAALSVLAAAYGVDAVRDRRADDAEERRLQAVLAVELAPRVSPFLSTGYDGGADEAVLTRPIGLRSTGPRDVTVLSASADGLVMQGGPVVLPPGEEVALELELRLPCGTRPADLAVGGPLELEVRTGAGVRSLSLPLPPDSIPPPDSGALGCGDPTGDQAVRLEVSPDGDTGDMPDRVLYDAVLRNEGRLPARLLDLRPGAGLALVVTTPTGEPLPLPIALPARSRDGTAAVVPVRLAFRVVDCASVRIDALQSFEDGGFDTLAFRPDNDEPEDTGGTGVLGLDRVQPLLDLVARSCPDRRTDP